MHQDDDVTAEDVTWHAYRNVRPHHYYLYIQAYHDLKRSAVAVSGIRSGWKTDSSG